jgi:hypothetical protein
VLRIRHQWTENRAWRPVFYKFPIRNFFTPRLTLTSIGGNVFRALSTSHRLDFGNWQWSMFPVECNVLQWPAALRPLTTKNPTPVKNDSIGVPHSRTEQRFKSNSNKFGQFLANSLAALLVIWKYLCILFHDDVTLDLTCVHPSALKTFSFGHDSAIFRIPFSVTLIHHEISTHSKSEQLELESKKGTKFLSPYTFESLLYLIILMPWSSMWW